MCGDVGEQTAGAQLLGEQARRIGLAAVARIVGRELGHAGRVAPRRFAVAAVAAPVERELLTGLRRQGGDQQQEQQEERAHVPIVPAMRPGGQALAAC